MDLLQKQLLLATSACMIVCAAHATNKKTVKSEIRKSRKRRFWVRPIYQKRKEQGDYHNLMVEMRLQDSEMFFHFTRMSVSQFDELLSYVGPLLVKKSNREPLSPGERLAITLRYLATGCSQQTLGFAFRVGKSTVCNVLKETCASLWEALHLKVFPEPSINSWLQISQRFENKWNFPHCIGAIDGKHVRIQAPPNTGSVYFNYKHFFSIVLLAICDENYKFTVVDIGGAGSESDGGLFSRSKLGQMLEKSQMFLPTPSKIGNISKLFPYFLVADEAFPLKKYIMRPYPGKNLTDPQRIFNYRLSRARRTIENAFGILAARWRVFHTPINSKIENVDNIVGAAVCLHNFLMSSQSKDTKYCPAKYVDQDIDGVERPGDWRKEIGRDDILSSVKRTGSNNAQKALFQLRDDLSSFFLTSQGALSWQHKCLEKGVNKNLS